MEATKQQTDKGFIWSAVERFSVQGIQFIFQIILARLLNPSDYGVIAMLAIFIAIAQSFIDSGFTNALIKKTNRTDIDFSTVFYFNILISIVIYFFLYIFAPLIARFYRTPELVNITRVYMLSLPISALGAIQRTQFTIKVNFKDQAIASFLGALIGGIVGVILASQKYGAWALVFSALATNLITTIVFWLRSPWRPGLKFSFTSLRSMFSFGSKLLFSGLLDTAYKNLYQFVIGKRFSKQDLGYYSRADQFAQFPSSNITGIMQRVTYPILCTMADDNDKLLAAYRQYIKLSAYIVFPLMIGLAAVAKPLVNVVLGQKWGFAATILQIICFSYMWYPIHAINLNFLMVKGRSDLFLRVEIVKKVLGICILLVVMNFNVQVMAAGNIISSLIALFINTYYTKKLAGYGIAKQFKDILPCLMLSLISSIPAFLLSKFFPTNGLILTASIIIAVAIYILASKVLKLNEFIQVKSNLMSMIHTKK
jgi:O-antigen/teichoic acid export membrane protein